VTLLDHVIYVKMDGLVTSVNPRDVKMETLMKTSIAFAGKDTMTAQMEFVTKFHVLTAVVSAQM
jgi:hypothetical protein